MGISSFEGNHHHHHHHLAWEHNRCCVEEISGLRFRVASVMPRMGWRSLLWGGRSLGAVVAHNLDMKRA